MSSSDEPINEASTVVAADTAENGAEPVMFKEHSLFDMLKQEVQELTESKEVFIPVAGYERTGLAIKYHLPDSGKELDIIGRKVMRDYKDQFSRNLYIGIDSMIYLCSGLYVKPPEVDEYVELDPEMIGEPVQFDRRMAEFLEMDPERSNARAVVKRIFGGNDMAVISHAEKLNRWLLNTQTDLTLELWQVGEAQQ
jgi:hypothetical protein